jgi:hypothetical protein
MRLHLAVAATAALLLSPTALAQPANPQGNTPAVNTPNSPPIRARPWPGPIASPKVQAKSRAESANISDLQTDSRGGWRGKAMRDGTTVGVSLDFQGNVTAQ